VAEKRFAGREKKTWKDHNVSQKGVYQTERLDHGEESQESAEEQEEQNGLICKQESSVAV